MYDIVSGINASKTHLFHIRYSISTSQFSTSGAITVTCKVIPVNTAFVVVSSVYHLITSIVSHIVLEP